MDHGVLNAFPGLLVWSQREVRHLHGVLPQDRQDLLQAAWAALLQRQPPVPRSEAVLKAFLIVCLRQLAMAHARSCGRRRRVEGGTPEGIPLGGGEVDLLDLTPAPESGLTEAEIANLIDHAPVRLRPWLVEFTRPGTTADIARRRGVTECTVRWWRMDCEHWILTGEEKKGEPPTNAGPRSVT